MLLKFLKFWSDDYLAVSLVWMGVVVVLVVLFCLVKCSWLFDGGDDPAAKKGI